MAPVSAPPRPRTDARADAAVPLTRRSAAVLGLASLGGLMMLVWPLLVQVDPSSPRVDPPFLFLALLPVVVAVVLVEVSEGGLDPRVLAILGVLSAANAVLRGLSAGTARRRAGLLPAHPGRTGLRAGVRLRAGLHVAVRLRPDDRRRRPVAALPDAGVGLGRDGRGPAAALGRAVTGRAEIAVLVLYGVLAAYLFGLLMNLSGWPFVLGVQVPGHEGSLAFVPGAPLLDNLRTFLVYTLITSTGSFDTGRAVTTSVALILLGPAVLTTLRRAARRATVTGTVHRHRRRAARPRPSRSGTRSRSASQAVAAASEGIRQSPRGDMVPPAETFGPLGSAERLNWLAKNRRHEHLEPVLDRRPGRMPCAAPPGSPAATRPPRRRATRARPGRRSCSAAARGAARGRA